MKNKKKIIELINHYVYCCGGNPDSGVDPVDKEQTFKELDSLLDAPENIKEAVNMLEGYLLSRSQEQAKTGRFSGAEGNMMFKLSQIKDFLGIKDEPEEKK